MKATQPLVKHKIQKKRTKAFVRFHSERFKRVDPSWRKPRGIDNRMRRRFKGTQHMPVIGYGSDKRTKFMLPNGFYKFRVTSPAELEVLLMHNQKFCAELAGGLSAKTRIALVRRAAELGVRVTNARARISVEDESKA